MPIKKTEKDIGSSPIKPPTDKELGIWDDWLDAYSYDDYLDDLKHFKEVSAQIKLDALKAEVLNKQQTLADKKKIAEEYLAAEAAKKKKAGGNPLLIVKAPEGSGLLQKATSVKGSSHDKTGPYGGSSSYTDADVVQARAYMQSVLGIDSMSVNGCALEHILAEVYGFAKRDSETLHDELVIANKKLQENSKLIEAASKIDKETVAKTSTGRRIKE